MRTIISGLLASLVLLGSLPSSASEVELMAIVPDHVGLTVQKSPVLYFYISKATSLPIHFILHDSHEVDLVVEVLLQSPTHPGFWPIRLEDYHVVLEEGVQYRWYVSVSRDPNSHSADIVAGGMIERVDRRDVDYYGHGCDQDSVLHAEKAGLWIDAFACVNELIEANPEDRDLRRFRDRLLRQERFQGDELPGAPLGRRPGCPPVCP